LKRHQGVRLVLVTQVALSRARGLKRPRRVDASRRPVSRSHERVD